MQNILLAIDVLSPDEKTLNFACYLAKTTNSKLTGVFLENLIYADKPLLKSLHGLPYVETILSTDLPENEAKRKGLNRAIINFDEACERNGLRHYIHVDRGIPAEELIEESRFADILIVDAETSFSKKTGDIPTKFVKDILTESECPVIISPESLDGIDEIIFAYDGSASCVFAIKQFTYLFPQFADRMIRVVEVKKDTSNISEKHKLKGWLQSHYNSIDLVVLYGEPRAELFAYLLNKENMFVVMGAYGRGWLYTLFRKSNAELVVKGIDLPVFVAHE
jgi:hypothetical protein